VRIFVTKYQIVKGFIDDYHVDALVKALESIDHFLNRYEIFTMPPTINYEWNGCKTLGGAILYARIGDQADQAMNK
jgi:hypothetical protein